MLLSKKTSKKAHAVQKLIRKKSEKKKKLTFDYVAWFNSSYKFIKRGSITVSLLKKVKYGVRR